jgi:hypothetical protein
LHPCKEGAVLHPQSLLLSYYEKVGKQNPKNAEVTYVPTLFLVRLEDVSGTCIGIPDLIVRERRVANTTSMTTYEIMEQPHLRFILIKPPKVWPELYRDAILRELGVSDIDDSETDGETG